MIASLLLKGALVLDPAETTEALLDVRIRDGLLTHIAPGLEKDNNESVLDAAGLWLSPGLIDMHTHLRDFGEADKEDIASGTLAAAAGGYTTVLAMANTNPPADSACMLSRLAEKIDSSAHIEVLPCACLTKGMQGKELTNMVELSCLGAAAFSDDGKPVANLSLLKNALQYARLCDRVIISHAENLDLTGCGLIHESTTATVLGLPGIPAASESAAIASELEVLREVGGQLHFAHVSVKASVDLIRAARAAGLAATGDATPHHLALSVDDIGPGDTNCLMKPPLRERADQEALIAALADGTLQAIATDHAPHTALDKNRPLSEAPFGIIGLETAFPVTLEKLVLSRRLAKLSFISLFTTGPASILGLPTPTLKIGDRANLSLLCPEHRWTYQPDKGRSKSHNSPFAGVLLTGKNLLTVSRGKVVFEDTAVTACRRTDSTVGTGSL